MKVFNDENDEFVKNRKSTLNKVNMPERNGIKSSRIDRASYESCLSRLHHISNIEVVILQKMTFSKVGSESARKISFSLGISQQK